MRIQNTFFVTLLATSMMTIAILAILMQWSVSRGMVDYINKREVDKVQPMIADLASRYGRDENWRWLQSNRAALRQIMFENLLIRSKDKYCDNDDCDSLRGNDRRRDEIFSAPKHRPDIAVIDQDGDTIVAIKARAKHRIKLPIEWNGKTVGWVSIPQRDKISEGFELLFLEQQRKAFGVMSLVVVLLSAMIAFLLARHFVRPISRLNDGANQLTQGNYALKLPTKRRDELGQLARAFNELANTLEQNESSRKRWVADMSHELRTPLAILSGEIDAMLDGVRPIAKNGIHSMKEEVAHLSKLVNDLYQLTQVDIGGLSYRKTELDLTQLLANKINAYQAIFKEKALRVNFFGNESALLHADSTRMNQLLDNLLTNAYRYTNHGGQIDITIKQDQQYITLLLEDSAPGVAEEALDKLFNYLYRTEQSRNRESGGSGLGLAICKRIVEGHSGTITASHSSLGGIAIYIELPK